MCERVCLLGLPPYKLVFVCCCLVKLCAALHLIARSCKGSLYVKNNIPSQVWLARCKALDTQVAIKMVDLELHENNLVDCPTCLRLCLE